MGNSDWRLESTVSMAMNHILLFPLARLIDVTVACYVLLPLSPFFSRRTIPFLCISYRNTPCAEIHFAAEAFVSQLLLRRMTCLRVLPSYRHAQIPTAYAAIFLESVSGLKVQVALTASQVLRVNVCASQTRSDWHWGVGQTGSRQICVIIRQ